MFGYCAYEHQAFRVDYLWGGPWYLFPLKISYNRPVCFQQYLRETDPKKVTTYRELPPLDSALCKERLKQCKKHAKKFKTELADWKEKALGHIRSEEYTLSKLDDWDDWKVSLAVDEEDLPRARERAAKLIEQYYEQQISQGEIFIEKAIKFYQEKAQKLANVEKSLAKSKKNAQKTMEEHWDVMRNEKWSALNSPHLLQNVMSFLKSKDAVSMMLTCSRVLHFVRSHVPVNVVAYDMGNATFNKWLSTFSHFNSLECDSYNNKDRTSLYQKLAVLAKSTRIDSLNISQSANLRPKYFSKFRDTIQKHQTSLLKLTVDAAMIPCFLSDAQLGKLQSLSLSNLNENNEHCTSWVEAFPKLTSLQVLNLTCHSYPLKGVSIPCSTKKFHLSSTSHGISSNGTEFYSRLPRPISLPIGQHCTQLEEISVEGVQDLTSLSLLPIKLKSLKVSPSREQMEYPFAIQADRLELCNLLPPADIIQVRELILSNKIESKTMVEFLSSGLHPEISVVCIADPAPHVPVTSIVEWEHCLPKEIKLVFLQTTMELTAKEHIHHRLYSLLLKYALTEYAKDHTRCFIRGTAIAKASDKWFHRDPYLCAVCGCDMNHRSCQIIKCHLCWDDYPAIDEEQNRINHMRKVHSMFSEMKKRKREKAGGEPPLKKSKLSDS